MKKAISIIVVSSVVFSWFSLNSYAMEKNKSELTIVDISSKNIISYENYYDDLGSSDVAKVEPSFALEEKDFLKELVDNGTDVIINAEEWFDINDVFPKAEITPEENAITMGYYINTHGGGYTVTPIEASFIEEESLTEADIKSFNEELSVNDIEYLYENLSDYSLNSDIVNQFSEKDTAFLQETTPIGNSFHDNYKFRYFYKKGILNYQYSASESIDGWEQIGSLRITIYVMRIKTIGTTTYDNVYAKFLASGLNDKYVVYYHCNMGVSGTGASIIDETYLEGNRNATCTTSIATEINSDGTISNSNETSYSYNPHGQDIVNVLGGQFVKTWECSNSAEMKNGSWEISPSITVKNTSGTTSNTTVRCYVSEFQVKNIRTYTAGEVACSLKFKNHVAVV